MKKLLKELKCYTKKKSLYAIGGSKGKKKQQQKRYGTHRKTKENGRCHSVKMTIFPKLIFRFDATSYQNPSWLLWKHSQADPKIHIKIQGTQNSLFDLKKDQSWRIHISKFQIEYKATPIKTVLLA